jgi:benzoate membrane transport protein
MAVGIVAVLALGRFDPGGAVAVGLAHPNLYLPVLSWPALLELVAPLAVSVLVVQNAQGIAVLRAAGHEPPVTAITVACGLASMVTALVGSVPTCLTGPVNAIISGSGDRRRHYGAGIVVGILAVAFGLLSPALTRLVLAMPRAFVDALAGLAMLRVLQTAFAIAFGGRFALGALACFLVTVADLPIARVGAPFWGLVLGFAVSRVVERAEETET